MLQSSIKGNIIKRNNKFSAMSRAEKRVAIAKDVLLRLKLNVYKPVQGRYFNINNLCQFDGNESLQEKIISEEISCNVCAKGAIFCSMVVFKNKITVGEANSEVGNGFIKDKLKGIFSEKQLNLIEDIFEESIAPDGWDGWITSNYRLIRIMNNIIENKGTFKP